MGNQLVGIAPSQIFPVEHYLTDNPHLQSLQFDGNLGSTRFFKVARANSSEGLVVVKVFAIHDPSLPLASHKNKVEEIRVKLSSAVNCLPFQRAVLTDKAGFLMREFVKYSLYDRMSTRPFFTNIEKKWIAFQVLYALHKCHEVGVCHGDIKLENIMVTSWHWVFLVDFASFKPTFLSEHDPADFLYFFDTSRRGTCYIAPERFIKTLGTELSSQLILDGTDLRKGDLTPAMDIFSAGCALTELFTEGHPPFIFYQLLEYRAGTYSPDKCLDRIEDPDVKELLCHMMQKDPSARLSAETYLRQERGRVFPEVFYSFLQSYTLAFSAAPILSADEKISRLRKDIDNIISILNSDGDMNKSTPANEEKSAECNLNSAKSEENVSVDKSEVKEGNQENSSKIGGKELTGAPSEALVIITSLVTSCIRGLKFCMSKMQALDILLMLSAHATAETILDRILPYVLSMLHDTVPRVRVRALHTLSKALQYVKTVPVSDTNIFPEYILPGLAVLVKDPAVIVRAAYAENIAQLAETALRFLEHSQVWQNAYGSGDGSGEAPTPSYEMELQTLHEMIQQTVATLITDPQSLVKQTLLENGITKLCVFFGKQKANDVLLSHMITFLNDKEDKQLRGSFFDCIVGVAAYVGCHASPIIFPLLQQGLSDSEELVAVKAVNSMRALTELGLLHKSALYELLADSAPFLVHPNLWLRHAVVGFISATSRSLSIVDVQCKVMQALEPYLQHQVIQPDKEVLLLNALKQPVSREILDCILKSEVDLHIFFDTLQERHAQRSLVRAGHVPQYTEIHSSLQSLFRRLIDKGMNEEVEDYLSAMSKHLAKMQKYKSHHEVFLIPQETSVIDLGKTQTYNVTLVAQDNMKSDMSLVRKTSSTRAGRRGPSMPELMPAAMNKEWHHMFGGVESAGTTVKSSDFQTSTGSPPTMTLSGESESMLPHRSLDAADYSMPEHSFTQYRCPPCQVSLQKLIERKQEQYSSCARTRLAARETMWETPIPPPGWSLGGNLVAHLHEHRGAITRLVTLPETSFFASASADGCIRLWDCAKMEGRNIANRSRITANRQAGPLIGLAVCPEQTLAAASQTGDVFVSRVETSTNKTSVLQSRQLDLQEDGCAVDIASFQSAPVVVYATMYGSIVGWDLRQPGTAWKLENDLKHGVITTMCVDPNECWLALGTSSGYHICWDLRFQLPISTFSHQTNARVRRLVCHPTEPSWLISAVQGHNEVSMWNMEIQCRQSMLWASSAQPFSSNSQDNNQKSPNSVCAMFAGTVNNSPFLITGGSDQRLRYWDLDSHVNSRIVVPAAHDNLKPTHLVYKTRLIDGINVVEEKQIRQRTVSSGPGSRGSYGSAGAASAASNSEEKSRAGPEQPPAGHQDWISDLTLCQASQCFLVSASCDGVIKVWK